MRSAFGYERDHQQWDQRAVTTSELGTVELGTVVLEGVMGWGLGMAVVESLSAEEIAARLEMDLTEKQVDYYTGALHMVGFHRDCRGVVVIDTVADVMPLEDERLLTQLSRDTRVVVLEVNEAIDLYMTSCWADGVMTWRITHFPDEPETEDLEVIGEPPAVFAAIAKRYQARQAEAAILGQDVHYYGKIVIELFTSLTSIEFNATGWWETIKYRVLKPHGRSSRSESVNLGDAGPSNS